MYIPEHRKLMGLSYDVAECYGKPHIRAYYEGKGVKTHRRENGAFCVICGKPATNAHHNPPISKGDVFLLMTKWGQFVLKPSLIAVCGSGTTGCHNGFHGGARYKARWVWDSDEFARMWWEGEFLKRMAPHSKALYRYGKWAISDSVSGAVREFREEI